MNANESGGILWHSLKTQASCRKAQHAHRQALIAELGWTPEYRGSASAERQGNRYLASSTELVRYVNEARTAVCTPHAPQEVFTLAHAGNGGL